MSIFCRFFLSIALVSLPFMASSEEYDFLGTHLLASYLECDREALEDAKALMEAMGEAVRASGAHILDTSWHAFDPSGMTMMLLLSESHATIHTYPEHGACFIDIFTCGEMCEPEEFHRVLQAYLKPKKVSRKIFIRGTDIYERL